METEPLSSPSTSSETTAQVHVAVEEDRTPILSTDRTRAESSQKFRDDVNRLWANYCKLQSWNVGLEVKVQELWKYGKDLYDMNINGQRQLAQLKTVLDARNKRLAEAEESARRTKEELSRCRDSWEQDSRTTNATIELLESDCEIYKEGAEALAENIDLKDSEIKRLTSHAEELQTKLVGKEGEHLQLVAQNESLQKALAEAQNLLQALEAAAEPSGRAARKKRKL